MIFPFLREVFMFLVKSCTFVLVMFGLQFSAWSADAKKGETLYKACIQCHGEQGLGDKSQEAPRIAGQLDRYIVTSIKMFKSGERKNPKMLPFIKNLSDQDIADLAAYVSSL
jgi:cytochrome c553